MGKKFTGSSQDSVYAKEDTILQDDQAKKTTHWSYGGGDRQQIKKNKSTQYLQYTVILQITVMYKLITHPLCP